MKRFVSVIVIITMIISACYAEPEFVNVKLGNYEYSIPANWVNDIAEGDDFNYHFEKGSPYAGGYLMTRHYDTGINALTLDDLKRESAAFMSGFIESAAESLGMETYTEFSPDLKGHAGILPNTAIVGETGIMGEPTDLFVYAWVDWDYIYAFTYTNIAKDFEETKTQFINILESVTRIDKEENSRKNPASIGDIVEIDASRRGLDYTMSVVVEEFYRGKKYDDLVGKYRKSAPEGSEYVAVKVTVCFQRINSIIESVVGTNDPEISVDAIFDFSSYSSAGSKYDNVHYSITGMKDLTDVFEGAKTTGYFQFMIDVDDPAPMLVYEPEYDQRVWISLK